MGSKDLIAVLLEDYTSTNVYSYDQGTAHILLTMKTDGSLSTALSIPADDTRFQFSRPYY